MVIFLTGSTGFIGRNLLEQLQHKYTIVAPTHKELDLVDDKNVGKFFRSHHIDIVIHSAFVGGNRNIPYIPDAVEINLRMLQNLMVHQDYFRKMICFGSGAEYDKRRSLKKVSEEEFGKVIPADQYGFAKYLCSLFAQRSDKVTVLRLFGIFGKYEDYETRYISKAIYDILYDKPIVINQNVFFDYLHINDFVRIVEYFIKHEAKEKYYNVGSGKQVNLVTIAKHLKAISKSRSPIVVKQKGLSREYTCDNSRLVSELRGFRFTTLDESLRELYSWYLLKKNTIYRDKIDDNNA